MPVENALVAIGNTGDNIRGYWCALTVLQSENKELKRENVELRNANVAMAAVYAENKQLRELLNYKEQHRTQTTRAAKVIARNFGDLRDSMYINIGKDAGLKREMAVLNGSGLVGIIDEVYDDYAKVLLITSARCKVGQELRVLILEPLVLLMVVVVLEICLLWSIFTEKLALEKVMLL
jgi:rod shape-determining protein MreC